MRTSEKYVMKHLTLIERNAKLAFISGGQLEHLTLASVLEILRNTEKTQPSHVNRDI